MEKIKINKIFDPHTGTLLPTSIMNKECTCTSSEHAPRIFSYHSPNLNLFEGPESRPLPNLLLQMTLPCANGHNKPCNFSDTRPCVHSICDTILGELPSI